MRTHVRDPAEQRWIEPALLALLGVETGIGSDELFAAWRTFFERLADTAPVVLVFEDLQHADPGLLDFIDHVMEWSRGVPITLIALARPELLDRRSDWGAGLRRSPRSTSSPSPPPTWSACSQGSCPGCPRRPSRPSWRGRTACPCMPSRPCGCCSPRDAWCSRTGCAGPQDPWTRWRSRRPSRRSSPRASTASTQETGSLVADAAVLGQGFSPAALAAVAGTGEADLAGRLRGLVRRELLALDVDPRSPGRGQYAFVQALVREVAYHTLSRRDRKTRHLAAARYLESLGSEEVAGALADHVLAAYRNTPPGPEADALAAQARTALRAAAARATALGSHAQALAFLEQALEITTDPADRAALHAAARVVADEDLDTAAVERHAEAAVQERRRTGDREGIAQAIADRAYLINTSLWDPARALAIASEAWEEFSDLEQTPAGVALMAGLAWSYLVLDDIAQAMSWFDRLLPIAERLGLLEATAGGIVGRGESLLWTGRPREGMVLLRGAHQLAVAHDLHDRELEGRILMTSHEQWGEPTAGLALAREGLEIARRRGSRRYGSWMVGNGCICALRTGDWDWAAALLDEWMALGSAATGGRSSSWTARSCARSGARTRRRTSRRRPGSGSRVGAPGRRSSLTSSGPGHGPRSRAAVPTRSAGSGSARSS